MFELTTDTVRLQARPRDKEEAIRQVGRLLVEAGYIAPGYVESMLGREQQANTYLGNGIAIPHGLGQDRELIRRTGIAVLQLAEEVAWKDGERARLLIGIAARSDEHLALLANLVDVLGDEAMANQLATTDDPQLIIERLTRPRERERLHGALATARDELGAIYESVRERAGKGEAAIFRAHQALLADPELVGQVEGLIDDGHGAAWAWQRAIEERVGAMQRVADERLAARAADLSDVGQRALRLMVVAETSAAALPAEPVILVADDLLPSDTARLDPKLILGLCTAAGGPTAHTAIIARSLGIPALVGAGPALLELPAGAACILDGSAGALYIEPGAADVESARQAQAELAKLRDVEYQTRYQPALTTDGHRVEVVANVQRPSEAGPAVNAGAEGIGLMRTEFLFLERATPPSEEEQYQAYAEMVRALNGLPLIIRTLDIGGDKAVPYLDLPPEENPFLGIRGLRLCLRRPDLFRPQLRAIYRAALLGPVKIMFPMVATLEELRAAKAIAEEVRAEVGAPAVELGIMVEVPSVVLMAAEFAREADFFSVGTNDLTQYALAMDRLHPALAKQVDGLHPAVLRMVDQTVRAAEAAGKWVGVCGGVAGEPRGAAILAGLGVRELSVSLPSVAAVKARLRGLSLAQAQTLARKALACATAEEVRQLPIA
jgi:phosphocarrier protein FPr